MTVTIDTIILDVRNAIQALNRSIAGVQAPPIQQLPTSIDTTNGQPFAMTLAGTGESWQKGAGYSQGTRMLRVLVYLDPVAQSDIPSHELDGSLLMQQFLNLYIKSTNTPLFNPGPYQATIESGPTGPHVNDSGLTPTLRFGGREFVGFEIQVPIRWQGPQ